MKMYKYGRLAFNILIIAATFTSCETSKEIDLVPDYKRQLVCTGFIGNGKGVGVYLQTTHPPLGEGFDTIGLNATISIHSNNSMVLQLHQTSLNFFESLDGFIANAGEVYTIRVQTPEFGRTESLPVSIPHPISIDSAKFFRNNSYQGDIHVFFTDPAGPNYYAIKLLLYAGNGISNESENAILFNPMSVFDDLSAQNGAIHYRFPKISTKLSGPHTTLNVEQAKIILYHINRDAFLHFKDIANSEGVYGDMWSEPPIVYSNILNGTGVFGTYAADTLSIIIN